MSTPFKFFFFGMGMCFLALFWCIAGLIFELPISQTKYAMGLGYGGFGIAMLALAIEIIRDEL